MNHTVPLILGAHFSSAKGYHHALYQAKGYGCTALQIFTKNASTWRERSVSDREAEKFRKALSDTGIGHIAAHTGYLINLAAPDNDVYSKSCSALEQEILRAHQLGIPFLVLHPGAHKGMGEADGIKQIADGINLLIKKTPNVPVRLLLETTAGQGTSIGSSFGQLAAILEEITEKNRIGVCLDTCHIFAAGYDLRNQKAYQNTMAAFNDRIGFDHIFLFHLNDSKKGLGARVDRHEHIGEGAIGSEGFRLLINDPHFFKIPKIIETPKKKENADADRLNLEKLRQMAQKSS